MSMSRVSFLVELDAVILITVSVLSPFCWGGQPSIPNFEKNMGIRKNISAFGVLKSRCHKYLHGGLSMFLVKKLSKMKYGFESSIFKCQSWPVLTKQPINVSFCDILVLLNFLF